MGASGIFESPLIGGCPNDPASGLDQMRDNSIRQREQVDASSTSSKTKAAGSSIRPLQTQISRTPALASGPGRQRQFALATGAATFFFSIWRLRSSARGDSTSARDLIRNA